MKIRTAKFTARRLLCVLLCTRPVNVTGRLDVGPSELPILRVYRVPLALVCHVTRPCRLVKHKNFRQLRY